uniref:Interleukin 15 receptor subunit alpha n=1 Tax=Myotis myotis TaxID=51298 RepID=A0A7J8AKD1_MYOMY|nr:interleukin 15 receptor subunit alpha [Myotis myotis]
MSPPKPHLRQLQRPWNTLPLPPSRSQVHIHPVPQLSLWQPSPHLSLCFVEHAWYYFWYVTIKNQGKLPRHPVIKWKIWKISQ